VSKKEQGENIKMKQNILQLTGSNFSEPEKSMLAELLHIIVEEIVKEVCND